MSDSSEIVLTRGQVAIVDAADYEWLNQWKWQAKWNKGTQSFYAFRTARRDGGRDTVWMHRLILGLAGGDKRKGDHREPSATLDNRRSNIRIATHSQNNSNARLRRNSRSGFKGASFNKRLGQWKAYIRLNGKLKHLGLFASSGLAHEAYCKAATQHYGEFARFA